MVASCAVRAGVLVGLCAVVRGQVGILADQIPFAADQDVEMEVNGDWQSGIAEEYVSVRLPRSCLRGWRPRPQQLHSAPVGFQRGRAGALAILWGSLYCSRELSSPSC